MSKIATLLVATSLGLASTASAQTLVPHQTATPQTAPTTQGSLGGLGGLLGGAVPNLGSIGAGNAAGLLGYCLKNNLLGQGSALSGLMGTQGTPPSTTSSTTPATTGARSIFERLTNRQGVQASPGFAAGQAGQVQTANGRGLSLDNLGGQIKTRMCSVVLNRAKSFL